MDAQELQDLEKVSTISVKNLNKMVNKMNNTKSSMIGVKPKDAIKLDIVPLSKTYPEETAEQHGDQKRRAVDFSWSKNTYRLDRIVQIPRNRVLYYLQDGPNRAFAREELMHISEDTHVPPD